MLACEVVDTIGRMAVNVEELRVNTEVDQVLRLLVRFPVTAEGNNTELKPLDPFKLILVVEGSLDGFNGRTAMELDPAVLPEIEIGDVV